MKVVQGYLEMYVLAFSPPKLNVRLFHSVCSELVCLHRRVCCPQVDSIDDQVREKLLLIKKGNANQLEEKEKNELKKRKLLNEV